MQSCSLTNGIESRGIGAAVARVRAAIGGHILQWGILDKILWVVRVAGSMHVVRLECMVEPNPMSGFMHQGLS